MPLSYFLERVDLAVQSIDSLHFQPPGLFTNAIVKRPDITSLLKDPSADEGSLYKVTKPSHRRTRKSELNMEIGPQRIDGKSIYVDESFSEEREEKTVVKLPTLTKREIVLEPDITSSPTKRVRPNTIYFPEVTSTNFNQLCVQVLETIQKYPTLIENQESIVDKLEDYQNNYNSLTKDVEALEFEIDNQKKQLTILNINYSDIGSPIRSDRTHSADEEDESIDIDDYIRQEEQEIEELEARLNEREDWFDEMAMWCDEMRLIYQYGINEWTWMVFHGLAIIYNSDTE